MREVMKFLVWMSLCDANLLKVKLKICTEISFFYQENEIILLELFVCIESLMHSWR